MGEILSYKVVKTRATHNCFGCGRPFQSGTLMARASCADGGHAFTYHLCQTCESVSHNRDILAEGEEFCYGELFDAAVEAESAAGKGETK